MSLEQELNTRLDRSRGKDDLGVERQPLLVAHPRLHVRDDDEPLARHVQVVGQLDIARQDQRDACEPDDRGGLAEEHDPEDLWATTVETCRELAEPAAGKTRHPALLHRDVDGDAVVGPERGAHGPVRSGEYICEIVSLGTDSHRWWSLLLLLKLFI